MKNTSFITIILILFMLISCNNEYSDIRQSAYDLRFKKAAQRWDEALPLGNGMLGALIWQKDKALRFSLDRADLWDLRPMENVDPPKEAFSWVYDQWKNNNYEAVQNLYDAPYIRNAAPSKIPAGALEFNISEFGEIKNVRLDILSAIAEIRWENGTGLYVFVDATKTTGRFRFENVAGDFSPRLIAPSYHQTDTQPKGLARLGYPEGKIEVSDNTIIYDQEGWGGFRYQIAVTWQKIKNGYEGVWSITSDFPENKSGQDAKAIVKSESGTGFYDAFKKHNEWWSDFWAKSSVSIPDSVLEKQWYLEQYKFGSAARQGAPPISLQAVWTADNGSLPPWKGDFHHDLNTQLSYWPAYSANHLDLEKGFLDWLWSNRGTFKDYTKKYFGTGGLNVPGVTTLKGRPMGGWIQYSLGPTVSAWLGQHFYLHWRYSGDREFLEQRAYPWISDVAIYLDEISVTDENGKRKLPLSSSPEFNDNSRDAWFAKTTNFDLALIRFTYEKAAELAGELGKTEEAAKWNAILKEWPYFTIDENEGLMVAPGYPYHISHRHFSHLMAIHPLGLIDMSNGEADKKIITNSIKNLEKFGTDYWVGYSFSWLGNLKARAFDGKGAAWALKIFATAFCLPNSFHVNGDQSGKGYSKFTYRPFTLEGNFAFAAGIQEMLLQSHTGIVHIFPAIPGEWKDAGFENLRAMGAFLVSAKRRDGKVTEVKIKSEKGGEFLMMNPFGDEFGIKGGSYSQTGDIIKIVFVPGQTVLMKAEL